MKRNNSLIIYCDFDGTITLKDISDELFKEYGDFDIYQSKLRNKEITITEYWYQLCTYLSGKVTKEDIANFADKFEIDQYFRMFYKFCKINIINLYIISDGFVDYIEPILKKYEIDDIKVFANKLLFGNNVKAIFPYATESCNCNCASCKRNILLTKSASEEIIVYIGDGYSDFCAAQHSDIIFAKKHLATFCNENKIPHYPYKNFWDIYNILNKIIFNNKIKKRRQAELMRKKAFEWE